MTSRELQVVETVSELLVAALPDPTPEEEEMGSRPSLLRVYEATVLSADTVW